MVTLVGTVTTPLLLESATTAFPEATLLSFTVQLVVAPAATVDELQLRELTCAGAVTVTVA
jgi:hypothetical protein